MLDHRADGLVRQNAIGPPVEGGLTRLALDPLQVRPRLGEDAHDRLGHLRTDAVTGNEHDRMCHGARKITQIE